MYAQNFAEWKSGQRKKQRYLASRLGRIQTCGEFVEYTVESFNLAAGGMCFSSDIELELNTPVRAYLMMPEQILGKPAVRCRCDGRVAHRNLTGPPGNRLGVGLSFRTCLPPRGYRQPVGTACRRIRDPSRPDSSRIPM
jgi:hypothetical protein